MAINLFRFISLIDQLKHSHVNCIVKCKKVERQFDESERHLANSQRDCVFFHKRQDDYLDQISPTDREDAELQLEKVCVGRGF